MKHQFLQQIRTATVQFSYSGTEAYSLRKAWIRSIPRPCFERDRLRREGKDKEADELAAPIERIEAAIRQLPDDMKPVTLQ